MHLFLLWFAIGLGMGVVFGFEWTSGMIIAFVVGGMLLSLWPKATAAFLLGCIVGWGRVMLLPMFTEPVPGVGAKRELSGFVFGNPEVRVDHQRIVLDDLDIEEFGKYGGKILVRANLYPSVRAGDRVALSCVLEEPTALDGFRYDMWLKRHHMSATCAFPKIRSVEHQPNSGMVTRLAKLSTWISSRLNRVLPEPEAGFARALLLGEQHAMSEGVRERFRKTGTSHIVALSGFNVTLILGFVQGVGKRLRIRFSRVALISAVLIVLFVIMTGAEASLVRASFMGIVVLAGKLLGRRSMIPALLAVSGAVMVLANPYVLLYDVGFQLSFLATLGLFLFSEKLEQALQCLPNIFLFRESLATTLAAMIPTAPLIAYTFRTISLVSPLANVFLLPAIPFAMAFAAVLALVPSTVTAFPAYSILHLMLSAVDLLAKIPGSSLTL